MHLFQESGVWNANYIDCPAGLTLMELVHHHNTTFGNTYGRSVHLTNNSRKHAALVSDDMCFQALIFHRQERAEEGITRV